MNPACLKIKTNPIETKLDEEFCSFVRDEKIDFCNTTLESN